MKHKLYQLKNKTPINITVQIHDVRVITIKMSELDSAI